MSFAASAAARAVCRAASLTTHQPLWRSSPVQHAVRAQKVMRNNVFSNPGCPSFGRQFSMNAGKESMWSSCRQIRESADGIASTATFAALKDRNKKIAIYATATAIAVAGLSYAAVPLYQIFCQATGYGGTTQQADEEKFKNMKPVDGGRQITVYFTADTSSSMPWKFTPQQRAVKVVPGETALAFYRAHNPTDKPVTGVSTYNVTPMRAGLYFNKIQCFCFEEQRLRPHEEIDMPVFFYIDPAFLKDPAMDNVKSVTLSYTFFRTGDQEVLDIANEILKQDSGTTHNSLMPETDATRERIRKWTEEVAAKTGVQQGTTAAPPQ